MDNLLLYSVKKYKVKIHSITGHEDLWKCVVKTATGPLYHRERDWAPILQEAEWATGCGKTRRHFEFITGPPSP
jgi:hypothetical protein